MMTNLFSMFDPSTNIFNFSINWTSSIIPFIMIPLTIWIIPNNLQLFFFIFKKKMYSELKTITNNKKNNNLLLIFISLFLFIFMNNFFGLFPYIFTSTSHLIFNLSLAFPLWLGLLIFGWIKKTNQMFSHLVPQGTPNILIPFMICIESISQIIRPITLTVRLTANMIAGHLLMALLGGLGPLINYSFIPMLIIIQILLILLESAVSIIQSYVFSILITLYASEI